VLSPRLSARRDLSIARHQVFSVGFGTEEMFVWVSPTSRTTRSIWCCGRIAAEPSGGMDALPRNGAVIALLAATGLTHLALQ
jgi:hypothetical protein